MRILFLLLLSIRLVRSRRKRTREDVFAKGKKMVVHIAFLILHKIFPLENALTEIMTLRKFVYLAQPKDLSSTYTVITRIDKFFVS
jgi:hypothetical protein